MLVFKGSAKLHLCVNLERGVSAVISKLQSLPGEEEKGTLLAVLVFSVTPACR